MYEHFKRRTRDVTAPSRNEGDDSLRCSVKRNIQWGIKNKVRAYDLVLCECSTALWMFCESKSLFKTKASSILFMHIISHINFVNYLYLIDCNTLKIQDAFYWLACCKVHMRKMTWIIFPAITVILLLALCFFYPQIVFLSFLLNLCILSICATSFHHSSFLIISSFRASPTAIPLLNFTLFRVIWRLNAQVYFISIHKGPLSQKSVWSSRLN